jgi:PAS domain-containing protein
MGSDDRAQVDIELILMRQLAGSLYLPVFIVDPSGNLVYYNEAAEEILGRRYDERGAVPADEWGTLFHPTDDDGIPLEVGNLPLVKATASGLPAHLPFWIQGMDGVRRHIDVTAFPLIGQHRRLVGGVALFWEDKTA